jgi:dihydropteroate synthase
MGYKSTTFAENNMKLSYNGYTLDLATPKVMGILNVTPDSFYDGGKHFAMGNILKTCEQMLMDGADIIDIGGVSTRPGAQEVSEQEEYDRVIPALKILVKNFPQTWFSIDTYRSQIAEICVNEGARIINDISGGNLDNNMFSVVGRLKMPYVLMHMHGTPQTMQQNPLNESVVNEVQHFFIKKVNQLKEFGVDQVILDPGFGFGKTLDANYSLLKNQDKIRVDNLPILTGISRKSLINKVLDIKPEQALNGTTILNILALQHGANILRVHDVREAKECVIMMEKYQKA